MVCPETFLRSRILFGNSIGSFSVLLSMHGMRKERFGFPLLPKTGDFING